MSTTKDDPPTLRPFIKVPSRSGFMAELEIGFDASNSLPAILPCHIQVFFQPKEGALLELASCPPRSAESPTTLSPLRLRVDIRSSGRIYVLAYLRDQGMLEFSADIPAPERGEPSPR
ncbi:hypothetical protein [Desulfovibrio oxyclinae]|uniref:hypothetical protein n=1 Tax=Desulfovibrio oxyclinae TaxID=63560 RepID=UPI000372DBC8|nr:hypothetical protein [Desulfovibrio oxyclinae]